MNKGVYVLSMFIYLIVCYALNFDDMGIISGLIIGSTYAVLDRLKGQPQ